THRILIPDTVKDFFGSLHPLPVIAVAAHIIPTKLFIPAGIKFQLLQGLLKAISLKLRTRYLFLAIPAPLYTIDLSIRIEQCFGLYCIKEGKPGINIRQTCPLC